MKHAVRLGWVLVIAMLMGAGYWVDVRFAPAAPADPTTLLDRPWLDHMPKFEREPFRAYFLSHHSDRNGNLLGEYIWAESSYKIHVEIVHHTATDKELTLNFLHDKMKAVSAYRIERMPRTNDGFDLRLTLARDPRMNAKAAIFYSSTDWGGGQVPEQLSQLYSLLR